MSLDQRVAELAAQYRPLAVEILKEAVRIPADQVDLPDDQGGDRLAGLSNHERPRLEMLRDRIIEIGAVRHADDVGFDEFGNLIWVVQEDDGVSPDDKRVIYFDGHTDTVQALREQWHEKLNGAIDCYDGLVDPDRMDRDAVRAELGYLPPDDEWEHLVFGRGSADQLAGVVSQVIATNVYKRTDQGWRMVLHHGSPSRYVEDDPDEPESGRTVH